MIAVKDVDYLIGTYELPERTGNRIRQIVGSELKTIGFPSFDSVYQRVGELVDKFTELWTSRKAVRLDQIPENRTRSLHEVFGIESRVEDEGKEPEDANGHLSLYEAVSLVSTELDPQQRAALEYLARGSNGAKISPELIRNVPQIAERLDEVIRTYERDGKIIFPQRPIVEIHWNPRLWVKFGKRSFQRNPLAFFNAHLDVYEGMSRKKLSLFDDSLYRCLIYHNQLDQAIPKVKTAGKRRLSAETEEAIINSYHASGHNANNAAEMVGVAHSTILRHWKKAGLETLPKGAAISWYMKIDPDLISEFWRRKK